MGHAQEGSPLDRTMAVRVSFLPRGLGSIPSRGFPPDMQLHSTEPYFELLSQQLCGDINS